MNKFGMVLGVAAVATLAGCKDPDYKSDNASKAQNEVKSVDTSVAVQPPPAPKCACPAGTKHASPCTCGDPNCKCIVEVKPVEPVVVAPVRPVVPAEPEYTVYVVQNGDYLARISKKFNVTINSIKRLNPSVKKDVVRVGQKLKIPGKVDVGLQNAASVKAPAAKTAKKSTVAAFAGATKEYVVRNGDTLGSIAYGNGINIRQLKALNGLTSDSLKIGQKLKVPAEKVTKKAVSAKKTVPAKKSVAAAPKAAAPVKEEKKAEAAPAPAVAPAEATPAPAEEKKADEAAPAPAASAEAAPAAPKEEKKAEAAPASAAPAATTTYVVQEGDDMTGVSIRWGVSAAEIRELNNLSENDQLVPGQIIKLPAEAQQ